MMIRRRHIGQVDVRNEVIVRVANGDFLLCKPGPFAAFVSASANVRTRAASSLQGTGGRARSSGLIESTSFIAR